MVAATEALTYYRPTWSTALMLFGSLLLFWASGRWDMVRTIEIQCRNPDCRHVIVIEEAQSGDVGWCTRCGTKYIVDFEDFGEEDD